MTVYGTTETNTYYALTDHLGTVWALVDENGAVAESYNYDAFGNVLGVYDANGQPITESALGNRYLFQGREYSWTTGLYNFRARWYDPATGRWLSNDPIGISGGLNQFVAFDNNPVMFVDRDGLWPKKVHREMGAHGNPEKGGIFDYGRADTDKSSWRSYKNRKKYHFGKLDDALAGAYAEAIEGDRRAFELYAHAAQDYFSHTAAGYGPRLGHFWTKRPDDHTHPANKERYEEAIAITEALERMWFFFNPACEDK